MKATPRHDRRLVGDEEQRLLEAADPYTKDLIVAALSTGCRGGELRSLQWSDVIENAIVIRAAKAKTRRARACRSRRSCAPSSTRGGTARTARRCRHTRSCSGNAVGEAVTKDAANALWRATRTRAKIGDLHFHDLRHEVASRLLDRGAPVHDVRDALGHTTMMMTNRYLQSSVIGLRTTFGLLDETVTHS
ncbi:MAG: site-specific integrase [Vicinamibacterales bacterium]